MDIRKSKNNFDEDRKPRCFNCNTYGYMAKECWRPKREKDITKCCKYNKVGHLVRDYRSGQKMKNRSIQEDSDKETNDKQECFVGGSE